MSEYLCRHCGAHYYGTHSCSGNGNWKWIDDDKINAIRAENAALREQLRLSKLPEQKDDNAMIKLRINQLKVNRDIWKSEAEMLTDILHLPLNKIYWLAKICEITEQQCRVIRSLETQSHD